MDEKMNSFSKEAIKMRMLQNAVKIWGLKNVSSIDPFVTLLIDAFSTEIFKANNEIHAVNSRILEKLSKLLTPSIYNYPQPAHAIAFTYPNDTKEVLPNHSEFFIKRQFPSTLKSVSDVQIDIHFTPIDNVKLVKMNTSILFTATTCYKYDEEQNKIPIAKIPVQSIAHNKIIIGIDASDYDASVFPDSLAFYCSNPAFEYIDFVFKLLPFVTITNRSNLLKVTSGLTYDEQSSTQSYEEIFKEHSMRKRIEENIKNIYKNKFIEITGIGSDSVSEQLPNTLLFVNDQKEIMRVIEGKKMIWLEMEYPPQYTTDILEAFSFTLNAFPVYNRKWRSNEYTLDIMRDNVPLSTGIGEYFIYVEEIVDNFGNKYSEVPFQKGNSTLNKGLYTIRKGGMERFNERNAIEAISNVLELTRDEVSAFGILERDKVVEALKEMTIQMRVLEQKITNEERGTIQEINYAIVNASKNIEHLRAVYWVTHCTLANKIRKGTILAQPKVTTVKFNQNIRLLTETVGGNEEQKGTDAIQAYKYALTTRDKLISIEDIKNFCRLMLKNEIKLVEVKRGTIISSKPKEGFIRIIEIEIVPMSYNYLGDKYWENQAITLKHQIMLRGIDGIEYTVKIKNGDYD